MAKFSKLLLVLGAVASALEAEVDTALLHDDQCESNAQGDCVLNALQMRSGKHSQEQLDEDQLDAEDVEVDDSEWLQDISVSTKNKFKDLLTPLQRPIVLEYQGLTVLDTYVNFTIEKVENATGSEVFWNKKHGLLQEAQKESMGRRRSSSSKSLPPRARYVNKILIYLEKEMQAVWNLHTIVDRKRWGVGDVITANPYGPRGEHPDEWKPNGSFPYPLLTPPLSISNDSFAVPKIMSMEHKNLYAQQLQEDYEALVTNIIDGSNKSDLLRDRLEKIDVFADEFVNATSGVFHRIETQ